MTPGLRGPSPGPSGGAADTLDEAKAAFRPAWERPLSGGVEEITVMLNLSLSAHDPGTHTRHRRLSTA